MLEDKNLISLLDLALEEDIGRGDITSEAIMDPNKMGEAVYLCKDSGIIAGINFLNEFFLYSRKNIVFTPLKQDGTPIEKNEVFGNLIGRLRDILTLERTSLNFVQRMSGIATLTNQFVEKVRHTKTKILDTRKTAPGLRVIDKEAVRLGGGLNHRIGLYDMFLIKDNHIIAAGGIYKAVELVKKYKAVKKLPFRIEVETRNLQDVSEAVAGKVDRIMLDNFSIEDMSEAVKLIAGSCEIEVSGGVNLDNVGLIADCGVDYISVGALTHSFRALDISLEF